MEGEKLKFLLILLEKAEQILTIINLPDSAVSKYNQLKELTFEKLNLDFKPLIKKQTGKKNEQGYNEIPQSHSMFLEIINKLKMQHQKKNFIFEFLLDLVDKCKLENNINQYLKQFLIDNQPLTKLYEKVNMYNIDSQHNISIKVEDLEFENKLEDVKVKEFLNKAEITYKKMVSNYKPLNSNNKLEETFLSNFSNNTNQNTFEEVIKDYERKIEDLRRVHEKDIQEYRNRFNELRVKYNPELENDLYKIQSQFEEKLFLIDKINEMLNPFYDKYYAKNQSWYEQEKIDFKFEELEKINFLISLSNKFFGDNKYLIELVSNLQKEKDNFIKERNLPYVNNAIENNNILQEIGEDLKIIEKNSEHFHRNFEQVMDFIDKNFTQNI
jgi:hypothetical protein